jgi:hypothetical protein
MSMIKVISPGAQDFSEPVASLIKISSRGLLGQDKADLVKRAGAEFAEKLSTIKFAKDEIPVHMIAIGATEDYGPNRNADGFTRDCCKNYHKTFEKYARFYRDHANKNPAKSYGIVKASAYHEPMKRIELIVALNGSKEAADRNGGLIADKEMEKLAQGDDIGVSMACKIPFDVCSGCGNKARTRAEYCEAPEDGGMCKAGGLKRNLGRVLADGHILHADNPNPTFFDISHVFRPADRIAYIFGKVAELQKAASHGVLSGAELAEQMGVTAPLGFDINGGLTTKVAAQLAALEKLAAAEATCSAADSVGWTQASLAASPAVQPPVDFTLVENVKLAEVVRGLVEAGVILPLRDFLALTVKSASQELIDSVSTGLPGIFGKLAVAPDLVTLLENNPYDAASSASVKIKLWAEKLAGTHSVLPHDVEKRAYLAALRNATPTVTSREKRASTGAAEALARHYALYKIASFSSLNEKITDCWLTANQCVLQNYVT